MQHAEVKQIDTKRAELRQDMLNSLSMFLKMAPEYLTAMQTTTEVESDISPERNIRFIRHFMQQAIIMTHLLEPEPIALAEELKDQKAYIVLREKLKDNKPLFDLAEHIHKLSRFMRIGSDIGGTCEQKRGEKEIEITAATFNIGCLPEVDIDGKPIIQFNKDRLRPNWERAQDVVSYIADFCQHIKPLDVFFFQEAFDTNVRKFLKTEFAKQGYDFVGDEGQSKLTWGSGLLGFFKKDKLKIHHTKFVPFSHTRKDTAEGLLSSKGVLGIDFELINENVVITAITAHQQTGGGLTPKQDDKTYGTSSEMRGLDSQMMHSLSRELIGGPIKDAQGNVMPRIGILYAVDMNKNMARPCQALSISSGTCFNLNSILEGKGFAAYSIKYPGDTNLFSDLLRVEKINWPFPINGISTQVDKTERKLGGKPIDSVRQKKAEAENLAVGSSLSVDSLKANKTSNAPLTLPHAENHVIDLLAFESDQVKHFESYIVLPTDKSGRAISDHTFTFGVTRVQRPVLQKSVTLQPKQDTPAPASDSYFSGLYNFFFGKSSSPQPEVKTPAKTL